MVFQSVQTREQFEHLLQVHAKVVIKYTARWCGPCKAISPYVHELAKARKDVIFVEIDIDDADEELTSGVCSVPTFRAYSDGKQVGELLGANRDKLQRLVELFPNNPASSCPLNENNENLAGSSEFPVE
jgi:thioredoxin 1